MSITAAAAQQVDSIMVSVWVPVAVALIPLLGTMVAVLVNKRKTEAEARLAQASAIGEIVDAVDTLIPRLRKRIEELEKMTEELKEQNIAYQRLVDQYHAALLRAIDGYQKVASQVEALGESPVVILPADIVPQRNKE